jgi:hypothetical protein
MKVFVAILLLLATFSSCKKEKLTLDDDNNTTPTNTTQIGLEDGDFEEWATFTQGAASYQEPSSAWWGTLNKLNYIGGPVTVTKDSAAYKGNFAAKLETRLWGDDFLITGILAAGYFDSNAAIGDNLILGRPFSKSPVALKGYFKYLSVNSDSAGFYANITRFDTVLMKRDTIAEAKLAIYSSVNDYTLFNIPFVYYLTDVVPDTVNVVFTSSAGGKEFIGHAGSTLWIDDVSFEIPNE